ncbi:MAG: hypothetical protein WD077_02685 [Bacteroidia bacterium]
MDAADLRLRTVLLFDRLQELYPSEDYSPAQVYDLLKENGFTYKFIGGHYVWLLKER